MGEPHKADPAGSFASDCRGAILLPAIVMGSLLVGALFYVAAAGDAIIFRTQLQDAADTTAFTAAIWHAKGLNMIALLNIFMSLLLFVVVILHFIELLCFVVGFVPGVGAVATAVANGAMRFEQASAKFIGGGLELFQVTEEIVSVAAPVIAVQQAVAMKTHASSTLVGSLALLPVGFDTAVNSVLKLEETRMPSVLVTPALPLQADSFGNLCTKSAEYLPELVVWAIKSLVDAVPLGPFGFVRGPIESGVNKAWDFVRPTFDSIAQAGDGLLCKPIDELLAGLGNVAADAVAKTCENVQNDQQRQTDHANQVAGTTPPARTASQQRADSDRRQRAVSDCQSQVETEAGKTTTGFDVRPARVWMPAGNGNAFMHTWSRASAQPQALGRDAQGMAFANRSAGMPAVAASNVAFAEAEFYFDCAAKWHECMGDATWMPNWSARIRRYHNPQDELQQILRGPLLDPASVLKDSTLNIGQALAPRLARGNSRGEFVADAVLGALVNNIDKIPGLNSLMEKANGLAQQGLDKVGLSDLFAPEPVQNQPKLRRIH